MSFILNALRKSEQERQTAEVKTLGDRILEKQVVGKKKNKSYWWLVLVVANIVFMAYFLMSVYGKEDKAVEKSLDIPERVGVKETATHPLVVAKVLSQEDEQSSIALLLNKQRVKNQEIEKQKIQQERDTELAVQKKKAVEKIKPVEKTKLVEKPKAVVPPIKPKKAVPIKKPVITNRAPVVKPKPKVVVKKEAGPPFLSSLSYDFRRTVPDIRVNVYVYSENKEERFIMVDMKKYQAGEEISEGMELKEIRQNSFVVEYDGRVFRVKH